MSAAPKHSLVDRARELRHDAPVPERLLWSVLRDKRLAGHKFRRQHPIEPYVADFYCPEARLVVELDGMSHVGRAAADERRTAYLKSLGLAVMRITNGDVIRNIDAVAESILNFTEQRINQQNNTRD